MFYMSGVLLCMLLVVVKRLPTGRDVWLRSDGGAVVRRVIRFRALSSRKNLSTSIAFCSASMMFGGGLTNSNCPISERRPLT